MGFSVSGAAAVVFVGCMVAVGLALPTLASSFAEVSDAHGERIDRGVETLNTEIYIENATYYSLTDELVVNVWNNGSTTLTKNDTSLLIDDYLVTDVERTLPNVGVETNLWQSGELLRFTVTDVSNDDTLTDILADLLGLSNDDETHRVKVSAENGVEDVKLGITEA